MAFIEIAPGIWVNKEGEFQMEVQRPDPLWIIINETETQVIISGENILVFSNEQLAKDFIEKTKLEGALTKKYSWNELVDSHKAIYKGALVDHTGERGFYAYVPLKRVPKEMRDE